MQFKYKDSKLTVGNFSIEIKDVVKDVVDFGEILIIRTDGFHSKTNENVYGVNENCQIVWQIKAMLNINYKGKEYIGINKPYSGLTKFDNNTLRLHNFDSTNVDIDPWTGNLTTNLVKYRIGKRPW